MRGALLSIFAVAAVTFQGLLLALKLAGLLAWPWWWVASPAAIVAVALLFALILVLVFAGVLGRGN